MKKWLLCIVLLSSLWGLVGFFIGYGRGYDKVEGLMVSKVSEFSSIIEANRQMIDYLEYIPPSPPRHYSYEITYSGCEMYGVDDTGSMEPVENGITRELVSLTEIPQIGDIVLYRDGILGLCGHRIIADGGDFWVLRGDAVRGQTEFLPKFRVLGVVVAILY